MKLNKFIDSVPTITELKPDITLYSDDGGFWITVHRENYTKWDFRVVYSVYDGSYNSYESFVEAENLDDCKDELEEHGFPFDAEWHMDTGDAKELKDLAARASMAVEELFSDELC